MDINEAKIAYAEANTALRKSNAKAHTQAYYKYRDSVEVYKKIAWEVYEMMMEEYRASSDVRDLRQAVDDASDALNEARRKEKNE